MDACANIYSLCSIRGSHYKDWLFTCLSPSTVSLANIKSNGILLKERNLGGRELLCREKVTMFLKQTWASPTCVRLCVLWANSSHCSYVYKTNRKAECQAVKTNQNDCYSWNSGTSHCVPFLASPHKLAALPCELERQIICNVQVPRYLPPRNCKVQWSEIKQRKHGMVRDLFGEFVAQLKLGRFVHRHLWHSLVMPNLGS